MVWLARLLLCSHALYPAVAVSASPHKNNSNATDLLISAQVTMRAAAEAIFSTPAFQSASGIDISARVVSPRPTSNVSNASALGAIYIDTNSKSRKYEEVATMITKKGFARANLLYYDKQGEGYVAMNGYVSICSAKDAKRLWWDGWKPFYPNGSNTSFYTVLRFEPDSLELVSSECDVQSGRADWLPVTLARTDAGIWTVTVPAVPTPPPSPTPPLRETWICSVCKHVYDPAKDGKGLPFEKLPDTWKCPDCGANKSSYRQIILPSESVESAHDEDSAEFVSSSSWQQHRPMHDADWTDSKAGYVV